MAKADEEYPMSAVETALGKRVLRYFLGSILGTVADISALWLLKSFLLSGYMQTYILAPVLSFEMAVLLNFAISYHWVWRDRVQAIKCLEDFFSRLHRYNLASLFVLCIKMFLLISIERIFRLDVVLCNLIALTITGVINFFIREYFIFGKARGK